MAALDTLLATQQAPNVLGAFNQGIQNRDRNALSAFNLEQAPIIAQRQAEAAQQQSGIRDQQSQLNEQKIDAGGRQRDNDLIVKTADFIGDVTDQAQFIQLINQIPFLDEEAKQNAIKFGADGVRRAAQGIRQQSGKATGPRRAQSSNILDDGTVQLVFNNGEVEIVSADEAGKQVISDAAKRGSEIQQERAQGRQLGKDAAKTAQTSFEQVSSIRGNVRNLNEVIRLVSEEGADTGPLAKRLPSITAAAQKLDNIRNRLGLDVISGVTFGALSEGELQLALDTALPTGLQGPALIQWAQDRITAQEKLAAFYESAASFLSTPGNTVAGFMESNRAQQAPQPSPQAQQPQAQSGADLSQIPLEELMRMRQQAQQQ